MGATVRNGGGPVDLKALAGKSFLRRFVLWSAVALVVYAIIGFLILPPIAKSVLVKRLSEKFHRPVAIRAIRINPFALSARVEGFSIQERGGAGPFVSFEELYLNLQAASLYRRGPVLREILLRSPSVTIVRNEDSTYNFSDLLGETASQPSGGGPPLRYSLNNIRIVGGSVDFDDRPNHTRHTVRDLSIAIPFLSNLPYAVDIFVQPSLEAKINGTAWALQGKSKPYSASRETTVDINISNFGIPHYLEYIPGHRKFRVPSGTVDAKTVLTFSQPPGESPAVALSGTMEVKDLSITDAKDAPVLRLPSLSVGIESLEPLAKRATLDNVVFTSPVVSLVRGNAGVLNVVALLPDQEKEAEEKAEKNAPPPSEPPRKKAPPPDWLLRVRKAALNGGTVTAVDRTPQDPVTVKVSPLSVTLENLSTEKDSRGQVSLEATVNRTGKIAVGGALGVHPVAAELDLNVRKVDLVPFQPYAADRINISLTGGNVSAKGKLAVAARDDAIRTTYSGNLLVTTLSAVDKETSEDFLKWNTLHLDGIKVGTAPLSVAIRQAALTDFYSRLVIGPDGTLNVQRIVRKGAEPQAGELAGGAPDNVAAVKPPEAEVPPTPVAIETVTFQAGRIDFTDHFIKPNYSANLLEIGGRVSGLSSEETKMADVDLRGKLENTAPLEITGKINPLRNDLFVDVKIDFKDMDLSPLTPYSSRYAGYTIEKGKLSLSLKYLIMKRKLDASNNVFLDQFTFGDRVESPEATKLPVRLAVALLKDRKGEIRLDLPVSGSLDDPKFSVWGVVAKIITNLLVKAATSPFALLGAIFGGGEELSYLEFDYGKANLDAPGEAKLKTLVKALHDRPALKLEITGHVDPEKDREALRQWLFDRKVRSQKLKDLVGKGREAPSLDNVVVDAKEYPEYLKRAYRAEKFPKPRNILGMAKDLPVPEMEKLMQTHIQVTDDDLRLLAGRRAQAVKDYLLASKQVEPERVFLVEPKALAPEKKENQRDSRVVFVLK
jgi:outer membrane protein OmpA-like peptidoglycan-associated protein